MKNSWSIDHLQKAWHLASRLHDGQKYGGSGQGEKMEYLNHIGSVTFEILNAVNYSPNLNADLAIHCAILHDTIEDTDFDYARVNELFGKTVADGVLALTKQENIDGKELQMRDSLSRIKKQPKEVWAVKMADRICNLYAPPYYWTNDKKINYRQEAQLIYDNLHEGNDYLADRLRQKIENYTVYIHFLSFFLFLI